MVALGTSLSLQLLQNRTSHLIEQTRLSALNALVVAQGIRNAYQTELAAGRSPPSMSARLLGQMLPAGALLEERVFVVADSSGRVVASLPETPRL